MERKKRMVIAEDHTILRESLKTILNSDTIEVVAVAENGIEAIRSVAQHQPDLLLLDLAMPKLSGIAAVKEVKARFPHTKVLILTVQKTDEYILGAFNAGADGYCLKTASYQELVSAIKTVLSGQVFLSTEVSGKIQMEYLEEEKRFKYRASWDMLTQREQEIIKMIGQGMKNTQIAGSLSISIKTVEKHRSNLMKKLDLHSASALTAFAIEKGLISNSH